MAVMTMVAATAVGCGGTGTPLPSAVSEEAAVTPVPPTPRPGPTVVLPDGGRITVELAVTPEEISRGLMFRPSLAEDRGMLFLFGQERMPSFWMKDTLIALDIIFIDGGGTVVDMAQGVEPCRAEPCPQYLPKRPAAAVLEVAAGTAAAHGLAAGDRLTFERVTGFPLR